ncbi:MAG: MMPL family transporter [Myxococcales bacterium]|nr:MMPL family transporter [Myxococcales bacterium]
MNWADIAIRRCGAVLLGAGMSAVLASALAATLKVRTDFARLLPADAPSVVALHALAARMPSTAVVEVGIASDDSRATENFAGALADGLRHSLPPSLMREVDADDAPIRQFFQQHPWLVLSAAELREAKAKGANPLYVDLESDDPPSGYVGEDGRLRMLLVRAPFGDSEPEKGKELLDAIRATVDRLQPPRGVSVGYAGDAVTAALEHDLVLRDVGITAVLCLLLVFGVLRLFFRSSRAVLALAGGLAVGFAWTFAFARLAIGELNSATAFLGPMVAGNGINAGIILLSRYLEQRRGGDPHAQALDIAVKSTLRPTLLASACAAAADLSLLMTRFRAFSEFGAIAAAGMALCWVATYLVLPPLLTVLDLPVRGREPRTSRPPPLLFAAAGAIATVAIAVFGLRALPLKFQDDLRSLRSRSLPQSEAGAWSRRLDASFGRNQAGGFFIGTQSPREVQLALDELRRSRSGIFGKIDALPNLLPSPAEQRARMEAAGIHRQPVTFADLPEPVRRAFTEKDGRAGLILVAHPGPAFDGWSVRGIRRAVGELRGLDLPPDVQISGPEVIFADMMREVETALPRAGMLSAGLVCGLLIVMFGATIEGAAGLLSVAAGLLGMIAALHALGVRLDFLSALAVPITIGIAGDYPLNVLGRIRHGWTGFRQTGAAVVLCSATTAIGYAVLLASDTGAIRSFGLAALLGEASCLFCALIVAPALARLMRRR